MVDHQPQAEQRHKINGLNEDLSRFTVPVNGRFMDREFPQFAVGKNRSNARMPGKPQQCNDGESKVNEPVKPVSKIASKACQLSAES